MINKISGISFKTGIPQLIRVKQNDAAENKHDSYILPQFNTSGYSLINFTGKEYYKTLEENYFKLPETASPDVFQKASAMNILKGNDVIVTAPTGTGKTAIALYAITNNMENGGKTFYTADI